MEDDVSGQTWITLKTLESCSRYSYPSYLISSNMSFFENVYFNNIGTHHLHYVATEVFGKGESHWPSLQTVKKKRSIIMV